MSADIYLSSTGCCVAHNHNITHNVGPMLREAGLDWHDYQGDVPETAAVLLENCITALRRLAESPEKYRVMSAPNGWGTYEQVIPFLARLAADCLRHPDAEVQVSL